MYWGIFYKPFPLNTWRWYSQRGMGFGLFVFLFLFLFKPFSLHLYNPTQLLYTAATYGIITGLVIFTGGWIFINWIAPRIPEDTWTLGKQIAWNMLLMVCIALLNTWVTQLRHQVSLPLWWYFSMLKWVVMLGIFPVVVTELLSYNHYLRRHIRNASELSQMVQCIPPAGDAGFARGVSPGFRPGNGLPKADHHAAGVKKSTDFRDYSLVLTGENQGDMLKIACSSLLAVQALDNYVNVYWEQNGELQASMLRNTLTNIAGQLSEVSCVYRSHRGWLVNTKKVTKVEGNAQGLRLFLSLMPQPIPVSRANIAGYRKLAEYQRITTGN